MSQTSKVLKSKQEGLCQIKEIVQSKIPKAEEIKVKWSKWEKEEIDKFSIPKRGRVFNREGGIQPKSERCSLQKPANKNIEKGEKWDNKANWILCG